MPDVNMQPLRDLLATHPEECAAVVALLVGTEPNTWTLAGLRGFARNMLPALGGHEINPILVQQVFDALIAAGALMLWSPRSEVHYELTAQDNYAIARMGAAAWLREKCGMGSRAPRYEHEAAIVARVAQVLGCSSGDVRLGWRGGALDSIGVCRGNGPELCGDDIAALFGAGFSVSVLGWDVPADCVGNAAKEDGEQR